MLAAQQVLLQGLAVVMGSCGAAECAKRALQCNQKSYSEFSICRGSTC